MISGKKMNQKKIRLSRFLADCGIDSRRKCGDLIKRGRISVNNKIVKDLSFAVGDDDTVRFDNDTVKIEEKIVIALNKPPGFLSTVKDDFKRKTVLDLVRDIKSRLYPAGRLDLDSRGLIILSNDGDLVYRITHPRYDIPKKYEVFLNKPLTERDFNNINAGILIDKKVFKPDLMKRPSRRSGFPLIIRIHEGRKRIIRRAFSKLGYEVTDLKRIMIGKYSLGDIPEGKYNILKQDDINKLIMIK